MRQRIYSVQPGLECLAHGVTGEEIGIEVAGKGAGGHVINCLLVINGYQVGDTRLQDGGSQGRRMAGAQESQAERLPAPSHQPLQLQVVEGIDPPVAIFKGQDAGIAVAGEMEDIITMLLYQAQKGIGRIGHRQVHVQR